LGHGAVESVDTFCSAIGAPFCEALFACCTDPKTLEDFGATLDACKATMSDGMCVEKFGIDSSYTGLRGLVEDGQTVLDPARLDACVAKLESMTAGGSACIAPVQEFFDVNCMTAFQGQVALGDACFRGLKVWVGSTYTFLACKEGRCDRNTCVPFVETGGPCSAAQDYSQPSSTVCDYVHDESCQYAPGSDLGNCWPMGEIGAACEFSRECISGNCDATQTCAPPDPAHACY